MLIVPCAKLKTVKKKKWKNIKFHKTFFPLSWSKFFSFLLWLFIISILNDLKKKYSCSGCNSPPRTSSLPPFYLLLFLLLLLSLWNLWENQANSLGPICVQSSRFYCNSCKVGGDCGTIALMHSYCILLYVVLREQRELLILRVRPTISIRHLWRCTDCIVHSSKVQQCNLTGRRCRSLIVGVHGPRRFAQYCFRDFVLSWRLTIEVEADWEEQSGQPLPTPPRAETGVSWGEMFGGWSLPFIFSFLILPYFEALSLSLLRSVRRKQTVSSLFTGAFTLMLPQEIWIFFILNQ